jgi:hypothetical protein
MTDYVENLIYTDTYRIFDRALYGGVGHGIITVPTYVFKVLFSVIFPPIGQILDIIENYILDEFPYITWDTLMELFDLNNLNKIIYCYLLTSLFYVPGLVFTLANLTLVDSLIGEVVECDPITLVCAPLPTGTEPTPTEPD